jgi:hypothetical protein
MRRLKSAVFVGLLVAVAMIVSIYAPRDSILRPTFLFPTLPGAIVAAVFALSSDANVVNGVITVALDWAVNTVIYWGIWEIVWLGIKAIKPAHKPTVL